jgi:outer membrane lipoprotein SlyB
MKLMTLAALSSLVAVGAAGCAPKQRFGPQTWSASSAPTVTVRNDNWLDVAVYVVRGASRFRIGTVRGSSTETFRLTLDRSGTASPMRILADPIGSTQGYVTEPITLGPGQRLELNVASSIRVSTFSIWSRE